MLFFIISALLVSLGGDGTCIYKKRTPVRMSFLIKVAMTYSPTNICSTIGAVGLNFSVRDGKRWIPDAIDRLNF